MTNRRLLLILSLTLFFIVGAGLNVQALTITNVSAHPNPFSPDDDGVKDTTTISFVISTSKPDEQPDKATIIIDVDGDGFGGGDDLKIEDGVPFDIGENKYSWDGSGLGDGVYPFKIISLDASAFGSVIIDTAPPEIKNVFVSLSPFSPNGDGINDVTEISFDLANTNPPGFVDNSIGEIIFSSDQSATLAINPQLTFPLPFGVRLKVTSRTLGVLTEKIKFTLSGSYKGALVQREFTVSGANGIRIGKELSGGDLYDTITSITDVSGATDGDSVALEWFTGNAVVKIYSNDGIYIQKLTIPIYIGDRENYHVRWGEKPYDVPDGVYTYRILAEDGTGNVSQRSGQIILSNSTIEILEHKPTPDRISPGNEDGQYDETSINYNLSKTGFVTVKIFDSQDNLIKTLVDDGKPQEAGAQSKVWDGTDNDGNIVSEGEWAIYTYVITAVDPLTSETVKASGNIVVDNQSPERAPRLNPIPPYTNNDLITISGTAEAGATVQISVGDVLAGEVTASTTTGEFTLIEIPLNEGRNTITAVALDSVANKSDSSAPLEIQVDKTPPVTIVKNVPKDWRQEVTVNLEAFDEGGSGVLQTYYTTDGSTPTTSSRQGNEVTLSENGVYLLRFFSQDNAGNIESVKQAADYIRIDKNSPTLEIISTSKEEAFFGSLPMIIISGTADDDGSGVKEVEIQITPGASEDSWLVANGTSDWLYSFIPDVVSDSYEVHVRATDNAGNQAEAETTVSLTGTTSPSELTATPISEGRIRLTWKDEGGIYKIYRSNFSGFVPDDAKNWVASVEDVDGVWLDDNTTDQTEYYYKIGRDAEDAASKKEASAIADKTPPTIENISATPNPFSPNKDGVDDITTISFTLTEETFVTLGIYTSDESSEPIKGLIYEALPAGDNLVAWDGTDDEGKLVNEGNYIYRFEKASTLDTAGNTLSQDISGTITCTPVPPLEVKMLDAQPNPFSPDGDKINDVINLNYILSDFADYVVVNIFDTSGPQQEVIARLRAEAFEYYLSYEGDEPKWVPVHFKDGIPPGRSGENYYLEPVDPQNTAPPPFGILNKPPDAQTIDGYLAAYQADYPNWRPVPFTIQWGGQGATGQGAYVYSLAAAQYSGISSVRKTGVILLEGLVVVPDDKTPPTVARTYPQADTIHSAKLEFVSADLDDAHGTGADLTASTIRLIGPNGTVPGRQSNDGVDTITWTLNEGLADDGRDDGVYSISVLPVDYSKNRALNPSIFTFEYNTSLNDTTKPQVTDAVVVLNSEELEREEIELKKEEKVTIPGKGKYIERIQAMVSDVGSGIDLSASFISLLDPTGAVVTAEKKETPIDRFNGQLLLRNIASLTDGEYTLTIQPFDNAGNGGKIVEYVFKYITVEDDTRPPIIESDTLAFTSEDGSSIALSAEDNFINIPIRSLTVDVKDEAPSSGINFRPEETTIQLLDTAGEEINGFTSYENQSVTPDGTFGATIRLTLENPLSMDGADDGDYTVTVRISDNWGNTTEPISMTFKYDTIAPSVYDITLSPDKKILNLFPEISIELQDNGSGIDQVDSVIYLLGPDGNRIPMAKEFNQEEEIVKTILKPDQTFAGDGLYTIVAIPQDNAGNTGGKASEAFLLDSKPPTVISMIPERGSNVNGEVSSIGIAFDDENGLDFKHPDTKIEIISPPEAIIPQQILEGKLISAEDLDDSLLFQLTVPLSISGVYTIRGKVADQAGNLQELNKITPPLSFTFDDVAPAISPVFAVKSGTGELIELSEGKVISETISKIKVDVSDLTSGMDLESTKILLKEEMGNIVPGAMRFDVDEETTTIEWIVDDAEALEPGVYKVEVEATDMAKNTASEDITFGFSPVPQLNPEILSITPQNKARFNTPISQVIVAVKDNSGSGIDFDRSSITVTGPGVSTEDYQSDNGADTLFWNFAHPFATDHSDDGEYVVTVEVEDKAENTAATETTFVYDTEPPKVKIGSAFQVVPKPGAMINTPDLKSVSVVLTDTSGVDLGKSTIELKGPKGSVAGQQNDNGVDTLRFEFAPLKRDGSDDGKYTIIVTPADKVGNVAFPLEFNFTYDTSSPIIQALVPTADSRVLSTMDAVSATLDDGAGSGVDLANSSIRLIRLSDRQIIPGEQSDNGVDTITLNFARFAADGSDNGIYRIEVTPKDLLGNSPPNPAFFDFTYKATAPLLVSTTPEADAVLNTPIGQITAVLQDKSGKGLDFSNSNLTLSKVSDGLEISGTLTHTADTLVLILDRLLATDGRDDGDYLISVKAVNLEASEATYSVNFTYDTQAPEISEVNPPPDKVTNESISFVSAKLVDKGAAVDLENSSIVLTGPRGSVAGRQTNDGVDTIKWEFTPLLGGADADGIYTIEVLPVDRLGNKAFAPRQFNFNLDTTPPAVSTEPEPDALVTTPMTSVSATLDDGVGSGIDLSASRIAVSGPSGPVRGTQVDNGIDTLIFQFASPLATDGKYTIEVTAQDILGNVSDRLRFGFEYKSRPPILVETEPPAKAKFNTSIDVVSAFLSDQTGSGLNLADSSITVVGPGVSPADSVSDNGGDTLFWTFSNPLATDGSDDGKYTVTVTALTKSGLSVANTAEFIYDTTAPIITQTTPQDGEILTESISTVTAILSDAVNAEEVAKTQPPKGVGFAGVDLDKSTLQLQGPSGGIEGRQTNDGVDTIRLEFAPLSVDGEYTIQVLPYDVLGNSAPIARSFKFKLDTTSPTVVATDPADKAVIVSPISRIDVKLDDKNGAGVDLEKSTVKLIGPNGLVKGAASSDGFDTISWVFDAKLAADGADDGMYTIIVNPVDNKGNAAKTPLRFGFTYTTKAPAIISTIPDDGAFLNTALNSASAVLKDNSGKGLDWEKTKMAIIKADGQPVSGVVDKDIQNNVIILIFDNPFAIDGSDDGQYTMTIVAADNAGVEVEYTRNFTYDTTPPSVSKASASFEERKASLDLVYGSTIKINESVSEVSAMLFDRGVGVDLSGSTIKLTGPKGDVPGLQMNDGVNLISLKFKPLATDGADDGPYTVMVKLKDLLGNVAVTEKRFDFLYDTTPPMVVKTIPQDHEGIVSSIDSVSVVLDDGVGVGVDFSNSQVLLEGPKGPIKGRQNSNGLDTIILSFEPLPIDITGEGNYFMHIAAIDLLGNSKLTDVSFTYKPTAPSIKELTPPDGALLNQPPAEISATLEAQIGMEINLEGSRIQLFDPQGAPRPGKLTHNGVDTLSLKLEKSLATDGSDDGWYTVKVTAMDYRGNSVDHTAKFLYDTTAPEVISTQPANGGILNENISSISAQLSDEHVGVDLIGSTITLAQKASALQIEGIQQNNGMDTIKLQFGKLPGDGIYEVTVHPKDLLGNKPPQPVQFNFRLDTNPPTVTSVEPADGATLVNTRLFQIRAILDDSATGSGVDLSKSTITLTGPRGEISGEKQIYLNMLNLTLDEPLALNGADDGNYTIEVIAVDKAGNAAKPVISSFVYDTVQPGGPKLSDISALPVSFSPNGDGVSDTARLSFALSKKARVNISVYNSDSELVRTLMDAKEMDEGGNSLIWNGTSDSGDVLLDGTYTVIFDATDDNDLTGALETVQVIIDTQPPVISNLSVSNNPFTPDGDGFADLTSIGFSVTNSTPKDSVTVAIYDSRTKDIVSPNLPIEPAFAGDGDYSAIWDGSLAEHDGEYTYEVAAKDLADNIRILSGTIVLDRNAPSIDVIEPDSPYVATNQALSLNFVGKAVDFSGVRLIEVFVNQSDSSKTTDSAWQRVMFSGDGIDNDLDGAYDEERYNKQDDDGDGRIDEDLQAKVDADLKPAPYLPVDWLYKFEPQSDGRYIFTIRATDNSGHTTTEADLVTVTLDYDTVPPKHLSTKLFKDEKEYSTPPKYKNGDDIQIVSAWDAEGYTVTADFSEIDSQLTTDAGFKPVQALDNGDGTYTLQHKISFNNKAIDGMKTVRITAVDPASNETVIDSIILELDNTPPEFISVSAKDKVLSNGMTAVLTVTLDKPGYILRADFSNLDSGYTEDAEIVEDNGDKTYTVEYTVSKSNTKEDTQNALIQFTAFDQAGNSREHSFAVSLDNTFPDILKVNSQDEDTIYKNGDVVNLSIQTDDAGYKVEADFSSLDSQYEPGAEKFTDKGDGTYIVSYTISAENTKGKEETLENLPVTISVSDEIHTSTYDAFKLSLDNQPPAIEIYSPSEAKPVTTKPQIDITGKTEALSAIKIAPAYVDSSYDSDTGEFSFTLDLQEGDNRITLESTDIAGNKTVKELSITYSPIISAIVSAAKGAEIVLPEEVDDGIADNDTKIIIPPAALSNDVFVSIKFFKDVLLAFDNPQVAGDKAAPLSAYQITVKSPSGGESSGLLLKPATIILQFSQEGKMVSGQKEKKAINPAPSSTFDIGKLKVFKWDGVRWNKIGGEAQRNNTVMVKVDNISGLFAIFEASEAPQAFKVYPPRPNPFTPNGDGVNDTVTFFFENPQGLEPIIRIYDLRGALVRELTDFGATSATWDGKDEDGRLLELGLYIYQIKIGVKVGGGTIILAR